MLQVNWMAAKSDGTHNKKIAAATTTRVTEDIVEETGFTCYPAITRTLIPAEQLEIILKNSTISIITLPATTSNLKVFTAGSQSNLSPTDVILDKGANYSIVYNSQLLSNMSACNPVTFDRLSGSINITQKGSLGSICDAYYHKDIIANILSVSANTNQGHILAYDNTADSFSRSHPGGLSIFTRRDNGLYVCNFGYSHVFVSTVSEMESQYTKREIAEARTARDFQRRLASPPNTKMIRALNEGTIQNTTVTAEHVR